MLDGRAIYGSNLGRKITANAEIAVNYFVVYDGPSAEQLGRLVRLLHVLGELRHAALFDGGDLREAGIALREMGQLWGDGIRYAELHSTDPQREEFEDTHFGKKFRKSEFYKRYGDHFYINFRDEWNQSRFQKLAELCNGDLSFRLGRSNFYAETFQKRIRDLRCVRIEGLQSYDDFMRRNIEYYFDRTTSLMKRFQSAQGAMRYINERRIAKGDEDRQEAGKMLGVGALIFGIFTAGASFRDYIFPNESFFVLFNNFMITNDINNYINYQFKFSYLISFLFFSAFFISIIPIYFLVKFIIRTFILSHIREIARSAAYYMILKQLNEKEKQTDNKEKIKAINERDNAISFSFRKRLLNWLVNYDYKLLENREDAAGEPIIPNTERNSANVASQNQSYATPIAKP